MSARRGVYRRLRALLAAALAIIAAFAVYPAASLAEQEKPVLIVCESGEQFLLEALLSACSTPYTAVLRADYNKEALGYTDKVVTTLADVASDAIKSGITPLCVGDGFPGNNSVEFETVYNTSVEVSFEEHTQITRFINSMSVLSAYNGEAFGKLTLGTRGDYPFAAICADAWYVPWFMDGDLSYLLLGELIHRYIEADGVGEMFVLIDEIYPFSDFEAIKEAADVLYSNGIPFIARIMPVYTNMDYPSFQRYADMLRYIQAKNASIVVHDPVVIGEVTDAELLSENLATFDETLEELNIFTLPMPFRPLTLPQATLANLGSENKPFGSFAFDTMIPLELDGERTVLEQTDTLNKRWLTIGSYMERYTSERYLYAPVEVNEDYTYLLIKGEAPIFENFFSVGNNVLLVIVGSSLVVFTALFFIGYRLYRRKFFR